jgi:hypothetical protein
MGEREGDCARARQRLAAGERIGQIGEVAAEGEGASQRGMQRKVVGGVTGLVEVRRQDNWYSGSPIPAPVITSPNTKASAMTAGVKIRAICLDVMCLAASMRNPLTPSDFSAERYSRCWPTTQSLSFRSGRPGSPAPPHKRQFWTWNTLV